MNVADSLRAASALERFGYEPTSRADEADVIVLNTCMVRQSAEDRAYGRLNGLRPLAKKNPDLVVSVMGCMIGVKGNEALQERFPFIKIVSAPSDIRPLVEYLAEHTERQSEEAQTAERFAWMDGELALPSNEQNRLVSAYITVMDGCSHACADCIIPSKRGGEKSRPPEHILSEARLMVQQGVKEIILLGQIVDRYGKDRPDYPTLAGLLHQMNEIEGLLRIRFLTSHPNNMTDELLEAVAELPRVMPHIEVPNQSGDDEVLTNMRRGYTAEDYRQLIARIRQRIPGVSIATDIIVGFPGETEEQFQHTYDLLAELKLDVAHLARYSPRTGTLSERKMEDNVPDEEKWRRFRLLEELQEGISTEINARYIDQTVDVLFEEKKKGRWRGRTPTYKLVFVESENDLRGQLLPVRITWSGPWSMRGELHE